MCSSKFFTTVGFLGLLLTAPVVAQFEERVEVNLVNVDALVTQNGKPVFDLEQDNFAVLVDGKPVEITHFAPPARPRVASATEGEAAAVNMSENTTSTSASTPSKKVVLYLDLPHVGNRGKLISKITPAIENLPEGFEVMFVSATSGKLDVDVRFTANTYELLAGLQQVKKRSSSRGSATREQSVILQMGGGREYEQAVDDSPDPLRICERMGILATEFADAANAELYATAGLLTRFVAELNRLDEPVTLLYVADGLPHVAGAGAVNHAIDYCTKHVQDSAAKALAFDFNAARLGQYQYNLAGQWFLAALGANLGRVTIYTLQSRGLEAPFASSVEATINDRLEAHTEFLKRVNEQEILSFLATETGGEAIMNTNDFAGGVRDMFLDIGSRYEIAFVPPIVDGEVHEIEVKVNAPGVRVAHRKSYRAVQHSTPLPQKVSVAELVLAALQQRSGNAMGVSAAVAAASEGWGIILTLAIPLELLRLERVDDETLAGGFTVHLALLDQAGEAMRANPAPVQVRVPVTADIYTHVIRLPLVPGALIAVGLELGADASSSAVPVVLTGTGVEEVASTGSPLSP